MPIDSKLKPLVSDLKETNIDSYLASSSFERLAVKHGFDRLWDAAFQEAERNRKVVMLGYDHKKGDSERGLIILFDRVFRASLENFNSLVYIIFKGYFQWLENDIKMEDIFSDLEVLNFPREWLDELRKIYDSKVKEIEERDKKKEIKEATEKVEKIDNSTIIETKKIEWIDKISIAETEYVINEIKNFALETQNNELIEEIINQSQRWFRLQRKIRDNVIDSDTEQIECNKINKAILDIIKILEIKVKK